MAKLEIFFIVITLTGISAQNHLVLFSNKDCKGVSYKIPATPNPDLAVIDFDNAVQSVQFHGAWLFYDLPNYNSEADAAVEYIYSEYFTCNNLNTTAGILSSLRSTGYVSTSNPQDKIVFYSKTNFQGLELVATMNYDMVARLSPTYKSFIIHGKSSWTIFEKQSYQGLLLCLHPESPNDNYPVTIVSDVNHYITPIPYDFIGSVHKTCYSDTHP